MKLTDLNVDEIAFIASMDGDSDFTARLMEMGFAKDLQIRMVKKFPFKGPIQVCIRNFLLSLRYDDAAKIQLKIK